MKLKLPDPKIFGKQVLNQAKHYAPEILTGIGVVGFITSTVLAVKVTPKACEKIEKRKEELKVDKLSPAEVVKTCWKDYIPSAISGVTATACVVGASAVNHKRNVALATACGLSEAALKTYQEKVVEEIGEKKEEKVQERVAEEHIKAHPISRQKIWDTGYGTTIFYEPIREMYFYHNKDALDKQTMEDNYKMTYENYMSLNEFWLSIGLPPSNEYAIWLGEELGWNNREEIDPNVKWIYVEEIGEPVGVMCYSPGPKWDFRNLH